MAKEQPTNIELGAREHGPWALSCNYLGSRFHIWLDAKTLQPIDDKLYKNPGAGQDFDTRVLNQHRGVGATIVPLMLSKVKGLVSAARAKLKYETDEEEARNFNDAWDARREGTLGFYEAAKEAKLDDRFYDGKAVTLTAEQVAKFAAAIRRVEG